MNKFYCQFDLPKWRESVTEAGNTFCLTTRMKPNNSLWPIEYLDAGQLVKYAFGLVSKGARINKTPILLNLFAVPLVRAGKLISEGARTAHRPREALKGLLGKRLNAIKSMFG